MSAGTQRAEKNEGPPGMANRRVLYSGVRLGGNLVAEKI